MNSEKMKELNKKDKVRLFLNRITGIIISLGIVAVLLLYYFKYIDKWILVLATTFFSGFDFVVNASITQIKTSSIWARLNIFISAILFVAGLAATIYGLISGNLILW